LTFEPVGEQFFHDSGERPTVVGVNDGLLRPFVYVAGYPQRDGFGRLATFRPSLSAGLVRGVRLPFCLALVVGPWKTEFFRASLPPLPGLTHVNGKIGKRPLLFGCVSLSQALILGILPSAFDASLTALAGIPDLG
jgi:hypothetical protein